MQQPSNSNELLFALNQNTEQLKRLGEQFDRLNERSRDFATRSDLDALRKELVARDALDPQLNDLKAQIKRINQDHADDKRDFDEQIKELKAEQISKQDRLWIRLGQIAGLAALALTLLQYLAHVKFLP